ncbi:putative rna rnp-1 protein [Daldinia childiae]|uniref:putative rna rnp-1 protein n=1 Tax=Daldinia childiae TaxID=326645 RepID=UPI001446B499|nr:putative rna rnp-1 protein [Daldinia childiae]KAF3061262.1 putative rna rnp-1 protein [Daldinia childiae]
MSGTTAPGSRWANSKLPRQPLTGGLNATSREGSDTGAPVRGASLNKNISSSEAGSHTMAYTTVNAVDSTEAARVVTIPSGSYYTTPRSFGSTLMGSMAGTTASNINNEKVPSVEMFMNMHQAQQNMQNFPSGVPFSQAQQVAVDNAMQPSIIDHSMLLRLQQHWTPADWNFQKREMTGMPMQEDYDRVASDRRQSCAIKSENEEVFRQVLHNVANGLPTTSPNQKGGHKRKNTTVSAPPNMTLDKSPTVLRGRTGLTSSQSQIISQGGSSSAVDLIGLSRGRQTPIVQGNLVQFTTPTSLQRSIIRLSATTSGSSSGSSSGNGLLESLRKAQSASPTPLTTELIQQRQTLVKSPSSQRSSLRSTSPIYGPLEFLPIPEEIQKLRSDWLNHLTGPNGQPTVENMLHSSNMPFVETCHLAERSNHGIVCISNIPYEITRAEIIAFLGRSARILNDKDEPVHIIMDRVTSKTNDCYVEFVSFQDAVNAVDKHRAAIKQERHPKLGDRNVEMTVASQAKLMKELFPTAHGIDWHESPYAFTFGSEYDFENFKGFVCAEEMGMLYKHAEANSHASYAKGCPERPFECMISTLKKMPWYLTERITIKERHYIYDATFKMVQYLKELLERGTMRRGQKPDFNRLTKQLFNRLVKAAMLCPGFTVSQKDNIAYTANLSELDLRDYNQPRFAERWCHQYALGVKPGAPLDVVEYYIALINMETSRVVDNLSVSRKRALKLEQSKTFDYWGFFWCEMGLPSGPTFDNMTLADVAALEWDAIEKIIRRAITGGQLPSY